MHVLRDRKLLSVIFGGCCGKGAHAEGLSHQKSGPSQLRGQKPKVGIARTVTPGEAAGDGPRFLPGSGIRRQSSAGTGLCPSAPRVGLSRHHWPRWVRESTLLPWDLVFPNGIRSDPFLDQVMF